MNLDFVYSLCDMIFNFAGTYLSKVMGMVLKLNILGCGTISTKTE